MGAIISAFRKEKTTIQLLENIEENIKNYEAYTLSTQEKQKRFVGNFLVISIGLYVIGFLVFYFVFFPPTWPERITYSTPLLLFPLIIIFLKRLVAWFFQRKLKRNSLKLKKLNDEKKKIIEKVMDKETYKVALEILNRFGDKTNGFSSQRQQNPQSQMLSATPNRNNQLVAASATRQQLNPAYKSPYGTQQRQLITSTPINPEHSIINRRPQQQQPSSNYGAISGRNAVAPLQGSQLTQYRQQQMTTRTPFPIIDQNRKTVVEKMVDYLIGDGPNSRFAMICKDCFSHNGMALQEEYEYTSFKCAFCNKLNPARKQRPSGPRLLNAIGDNATPGGSNTTSTNSPKQLKTRDNSSDQSSSDSDSSSESDVSTTTETHVPQEIRNEENTEQIINENNVVNNEEIVNERDTEQEEIIVNKEEKAIEEKKND